MNESQKHRVNYLNQWPNIPYEYKKIFSFANDDIFLNLKKFKNIDTNNYDKGHNIIMSFMVEGFYFLNVRPDIASDYFWKALEKSIKELYEGKNMTDLIKIFSNESFMDNEEIISILDLINNKIPYSLSNSTSSCINSTDNNVKFHLRNNVNESIIDYLLNDNNFNTNREKGFFISTFLKNKSILINEEIIQLSNNEINYFIIYGILYTNRNKRAHGNSISPFLSSNLSKKSYLFNYYIILYIYFYLMLILKQLGYMDFSNDELRENIEINLEKINIIFNDKKIWN